MELRLMPIDQICTTLHISKATVYRLIANNGFPRPIKIGPARSVWREEEIEQWVNNRDEMEG